MSALLGVRSYKKSFSKEKIIEILLELVENNHIDRCIVELIIKDYDNIVSELTVDF